GGGHFHITSGPIVLYPGGKKIHHHLEKTGPIPEHRTGDEGAVIHPQSDLTGIGERLNQIHRSTDQFLGTDGLDLEIELAFLRLGDVEQFIDELQKAPAGPENLADAFAVLADLEIQFEQLSEAENGVERRA